MTYSVTQSSPRPITRRMVKCLLGSRGWVNSVNTGENTQPPPVSLRKDSRARAVTRPQMSWRSLCYFYSTKIHGRQEDEGAIKLPDSWGMIHLHRGALLGRYR